MAVSLIPPIGSSGTWGLRAPYNSLINVELTYSCVAVRRLSEFRLLGIDPFTMYYEPYSVSNGTYASDLAQGDVCIVSLQSASGALVFVPSTYINSYPNPNGFKYTPVILAVDIGSIPDRLNLNAMKTDMVDLIKSYLGIENVVVTTVAVGEDKMLNQNDHNSIEAARLGRITASKTLHGRNTELLNQVQALSTRNAELENQILLMINNPP
jgi:hypothetical protein